MPGIVVQVRGQGAAEVDACARHVERDLADLGVSLTPLHPGIADSALQPWYSVSLPSDGRPEDVVRALRAHPDVVAAYEKPAEAPP